MCVCVCVCAYDWVRACKVACACACACACVCVYTKYYIMAFKRSYAITVDAVTTMLNHTPNPPTQCHTMAHCAGSKLGCVQVLLQGGHRSYDAGLWPHWPSNESIAGGKVGTWPLETVLEEDTNLRCKRPSERKACRESPKGCGKELAVGERRGRGFREQQRQRRWFD